VSRKGRQPERRAAAVRPLLPGCGGTRSIARALSGGAHRLRSGKPIRVASDHWPALAGQLPSGTCRSPARAVSSIRVELPSNSRFAVACSCDLPRYIEAGCHHVSPLHLAQSRSVVMHSHPDSMARAERQAPCAMLPVALESCHRNLKLYQYRSPGTMAVVFGSMRTTRQNSKASFKERVRAKIRRWVQMRTTLAST
jgi:hypothetical protein